MPNSKAQIANRQAILDRNEPVFQQMLEYRKANPTVRIDFETLHTGHVQAIRSRLKELGFDNVSVINSQGSSVASFTDPNLNALME